MEAAAFNPNMSLTELNQLKKEIGNFNLANKKPRDPKTEKMGKNEFLKLLVTQLAKQDPLNPMKNTEFISQMAQFSALEQMHNVGKAMGNMVERYGRIESQQMVGKYVSYSDSATSQKKEGIVSGLLFEANNKVSLMVGSDKIKPSDILGIHHLPAKTTEANKAYQAGAKTIPPAAQ